MFSLDVTPFANHGSDIRVAQYSPHCDTDSPHPIVAPGKLFFRVTGKAAKLLDDTRLAGYLRDAVEAAEDEILRTREGAMSFMNAVRAGLKHIPDIVLVDYQITPVSSTPVRRIFRSDPAFPLSSGTA